MAQENKLNRKDLVLITKKLKENKTTCIVNNKIVLKINHYKTY